jgi:hypothetical protein
MVRLGRREREGNLLPSRTRTNRTQRNLHVAVMVNYTYD